MIKRVIALVLCLGILFTISSTAFADYGTEGEYKERSLRWSYVTIATTDLSINSTGLATCSLSIKGNSNMTKAKMVIDLQQYNNDKWQTVKSWTVEQSGTVSSTNQSYYVTSGYNYRTYATSYVYSGSAYETITTTSPERKY